MPPFFPVEKLNNAHAAVETNSRVLSPVVTGSTPRYRSSPQFHAPAKQPSSPAEFSSPIGPIPHLLPSLGLVVSSIPAPNNLGRKPLPLTFALCSLTQFYIVLPEWLFGFAKKRLSYTLLRVAQRLHDFLSPPQSPRILSFLLPQSNLETCGLGIPWLFRSRVFPFFPICSKSLFLFSSSPYPGFPHPLLSISNLIPR